MSRSHVAVTSKLIQYFILLDSVLLGNNVRGLPNPLNLNKEVDSVGHTEDVLVRNKRSGLIDAADSGDIQTEALVQGYTIYRKRLSWKEAHDVCERKEGHLASFINEADAKAVIDSIFEKSKFDEEYDWGKKTEEFGLDRRYWIGLTDILEEGKWGWAGKGRPLTYSSMWYPNQPDHVNNDGSIKSGRLQHCVTLWNPAYWKVGADKQKSQKHSFDDTECDFKYYFICEKDAAKLDALKKASESGGAAAPAPASPAGGAPAPAPPPGDSTATAAPAPATEAPPAATPAPAKS